MAWISVHEQVLGKKLRTLAKELGSSQNEALGMLIRVWLWGINNANKDGEIQDATNEDVAEILNVGMAKELDADKAVDALIATEWLDAGGGNLYLHDWKDWQAEWYRLLERREKDRERARAAAKAKRESAKSEEKRENATPVKQKSSEKGTNYTMNQFNEFWEVYPKKVGKGEAYKKYLARIKDGWKPSELIIAATNYQAECTRNKTEAKWIKHAKTFLSENTPFEDYIHHEEEHVKKTVDDNDPYKGWR